MAFYTVSTAEEKISDRQGGNYINESGVYDVILKRVCVDTGKNGAIKLHLFIEYEGTPQVLYNAITLTNNNGKENFQNSVFNKLLICIGASEGDVIGDPVEAVLPIGKDKQDKRVMVVPDIEDVDVTLRIVMEYGSYEGKITEHKSVRNAFRSKDHATASEIVNFNPKTSSAADLGKQYAIEADEKVCKKTVYRNGVTPEDVEAYKKQFTNSNTAKEEPEAKTFSAKKGSEEQMDDLPF